MGRTIYSSKRSLNVYCVYECPHCGKLTYCKEAVSEKASTSKFGAFHSKSQKEENFKEVSSASSYMLMDKMNRILNEAKNHKYRTAEFKGRCFYCHYQLPWQKMRYAIFNKLFFNILLKVELFFLLIALSGSYWLEAVVSALIYGTIALAYTLIKNSHRKFIEEKIENLPIKSLPIIFLTEEEMLNFLKENNINSFANYDYDTIHRKTDYEQWVKDVEFCNVCGADISKDSQTCHVCGNKI